ncbi:MAG: ethylbenzene dehydrogenase-related protein [Haloarculaceae archaeon]
MSDRQGASSSTSDEKSGGVRMSDRQGASRELLWVGAFAALLLATAAVGPMVVDARPAFEIPVHSGADGDNLENVESDAWAQAPAATVSLSSSGASVPSADNVTVERVSVAAAQTDERLYLRLSWADATNDTSTRSLRSFADAVAVQIPANASARPPITMGGSDNMVNVWYWSADNTTEELLAGGPGSTSTFAENQVTTNATYNDGRWTVVFSRPLNVSGANHTTIPSDADMDMSVAVWNGSNFERSGQKAVSDWYYLALGPGAQGPPYQTILWVIAGLAIVVSMLVTIEGVRRTRGADGN